MTDWKAFYDELSHVDSEIYNNFAVIGAWCVGAFIQAKMNRLPRAFAASEQRVELAKRVAEEYDRDVLLAAVSRFMATDND